MFDFFSLIWTIIWTSVSDSFMQSDLALLIYLGILALVFCYFANLIRMMRRF